MESYTTIEGHPNILVEKCCSDKILRTFKEWGVQWPDGVRRWNTGPTKKIECAGCGRELQFKIREADHA